MDKFMVGNFFPNKIRKKGVPKYTPGVINDPTLSLEGLKKKIVKRSQYYGYGF